MKINQRSVLLLKSQANESENRYETLLRNEGYDVGIICVLEFKYCNFETLRQKLNESEDYEGLIFTSPRSVKAVSECILKSESIISQWKDKKCFVVGESTKQEVESLLQLHSEGSHSGNSKNLAEFISQGTYSKPFLFPCGSLASEKLLSMLSSVESLTVYETVPHADIEKSFNELTQGGQNVPEFLAFFSPSGLNFCLPVMTRLNLPFDEIKFVAIGPTTEESILKANLPLWATAAKPNPD